MKFRILLGVVFAAPLLFSQATQLPGSTSSSGGSGVSYCAPASASGTTYTCAPSPALTSYTSGTTLGFVPDVNGTAGAITVNVNSLGAKSIKESDGSTNPVAGDLVAGKSYALLYDGTVFRITPGLASPAYLGAINAIGSAGASQTIACTGGGVQSMTLSANLTITLTQPSGTTCLIRMEITQAGGGGGDTVTITGAKWPGGIAPVMTATAGAVDVWSCLLDGTTSYCTVGQNFQ